MMGAELASNGWAIGSERSESGGGMLIANPHYPWEGSNRFWEKHLTIPGRLDGYGVSLLGAPGISIGFNANVAWTHTVSAGQRHTLYRLRLADDDPTVYLYDGERRPMRKETVEVEVRGDDGATRTETRAVWFSHYGPILDWPDLPWTARSAITYRDANEANDDSTATYLAMIEARDLDQFQKAHDELQGILFVNTIAASSDGRAWYADVSAAPNLSEATVAAWRERLAGDAVARDLYDKRGMILLDGSTSRDEWVADGGARPRRGALRGDAQARAPRLCLQRQRQLLDAARVGAPRGLLAGARPERAVRSLRTRQNMTTLSDLSPTGPAGDDGKWSLDELEAAALSNRSFTAKLLLPELVERCRATRGPWSTQEGGPGARLRGARRVRRQARPRQRGAVLFREWITRYEPADLRRKGALYAVDFDPADPIGTPRGLAPGRLAIENLARAVGVLDVPGSPSTPRCARYSTAAGAAGRFRSTGATAPTRASRTWCATPRTPPRSNRRPSCPRRSRAAAGSPGTAIPVTTGTSFLMALEFTKEGPRAQAFLTYGESGTRSRRTSSIRPALLAEGVAADPVDERDIAADPSLKTIAISSPRADRP